MANLEPQEIENLPTVKRLLKRNDKAVVDFNKGEPVYHDTKESSESISVAYSIAKEAVQAYADKIKLTEGDGINYLLDQLNLNYYYALKLKNVIDNRHWSRRQTKYDSEAIATLSKDLMNIANGLFELREKVNTSLISPQLLKKNEEIERLKGEVERLKGKTWCAYCGQEYPLDTVTAEQIGEHINTCEKHPLFQAKKMLEAKDMELDQALQQAKQDERERIEIQHIDAID